MKLKNKAIPVVMMILTLFFSASVFAGEINWTDYKTGKKLSQESGKKLYIYFYTNSCPWCKKMERETFGSEKIINYMNKNFIPVKINTYKDIATSKMYQVGPVPTNIFVEPDIKTIIYKRPGYIPKKYFFDIIEAIKMEKYK